MQTKTIGLVTALFFLAGVVAVAAATKPLKVFILAGQSNMEGQAVVDLEGKDYNEGKGTLAMLLRDPARSGPFRHLQDAAGHWTVRDDVWVRYQREQGPLLAGPLGVGFTVYGDAHHFGPELQFGQVVGDHFENQVLLIKTAWGGKSLYKDFRPPSSGGIVGPYYLKMLGEIRAALTNLATDFPGYSGAYELAGFVWYHGWNDGVNPKTAVPEYETNLVNLVKDVRREFNAPALPVVIGELTGPWIEATGGWAALRHAQAAAADRPEFKGNVVFVPTHDFVRKAEDSPNPGHGHHEFGNAETYFLVGDALGQAMVKLSPSSGVRSAWPAFRGPNSSGVAEHDKPPIEFGPATNLLWKVETDPGLSSPCIWGDRIFLTAVEEGKLVTLALDRRDGKRLWRQEVAADKPRELHKKNNPAAATPATDGQAVCVYHAGWGLITYDFDGRELWRKPLPGLYARNGSGTSPALIGGKLVLNCDVEEDKSFIAAYEPATGRELWRTARTDFHSGYTTPIRWERAGRDEVIVVGSLRVVGYNLSDGKERWTVGGTEAVSVAPTPVLGDGQLYVMSRSFGGARMPPFALFGLGLDKDGDGKISREEIPKSFIEQGMFAGLDRNQDGFITATEWDESVAFLNKADYGIFAVKAPGEGTLGTNDVAWTHKKGVAGVSSPLFYRGRIYVGQDGGRVTCFNARTGEKFYEQERINADGEYFASPIAADGHVYFASSKGTVTIIAAGDALEVQSRNKLGESILATPAIVDDKLYVRTDRHVWAFGTK